VIESVKAKKMNYAYSASDCEMASIEAEHFDVLIFHNKSDERLAEELQHLISQLDVGTGVKIASCEETWKGLNIFDSMQDALDR